MYRILLFLVTANCFIYSALASPPFVDDAESWELPVGKPEKLISESANVSPPVMVEYATALFRQKFEEPEKLISESVNVSPPVMVEYATALFRQKTAYPGDFNSDGILNLEDAIIIIKLLSGKTDCINNVVYITGNNRAEIDDAVYILQKISAIRDNPWP